MTDNKIMNNPNENKTNTILECFNITKSYRVNRKQVSVLKEIDLSINRGEIIVIKGKSGAGKSTLMEILGGLSRPDSGSVNFNQINLASLSNEKLSAWRRENVGIIFQSFNLIPTWTAYENVEAVLINNGFSKSLRQDEIKRQFSIIGLEDRINHLPSELSVGQQQRVAIARATINDPLIILADEPTGELDKETSEELNKYLISTVKENGITLIITTHGPFPLDAADRVFHLEGSRLQEINSSESNFYPKLNKKININ